MAPQQARELPPASDVDPEKEDYFFRMLKTPVLSGAALSVFTSAYESSLGRTIYSMLSRDSGVHQVLHDITIPEQPLFLPLCPVKEVGEEPGCVEVQGNSAVEVITTLLQQGWVPELHLDRQQQQQRQQQDGDAGTPAPAAPADGTAGEGTSGAQEGVADSKASQYRRPTVADYVAAYRSGKTTPSEVMERVISFIERSKVHKCDWFIFSSAEEIRKQAAASTQRWAAGKPLSFLDGVPYGVKDVLDAEPYQTTVGTSFAADKWPSSGNAPYVAALKSLGAILLGKLSLHEIGLGVTGLNQRTGTARNPYDLTRFCGGSSSGSGAVLAAGLCPFAIGTDGGGSIRIPASFCGVMGLKPTNGRVTADGSFKVDCTVAVLGPMAASVQDAALLYVVMANFNQWYTVAGERMPAARLPKPLAPAEEQPLKGRKAGIYWEWFRDADNEVVAACTAAVALLESVGGVEVQSVRIPELELLRVAHNVTIASEMLHSFQPMVEDPKQRALFNADVRLGLDSARFWTPADYLQAQRIRQRATTHFRRAMKDVDVLITPTIPRTAPAIPKAALKGAGHSDLTQLSAIMRFAQPANLLGLPGASVPVGVDGKGLPIGLQIMGKPWTEATVLRYAAVLEKALADKAAKAGTGPVAGVPKVWIDPLTGASAGLD